MFGKGRDEFGFDHLAPKGVASLEIPGPLVHSFVASYSTLPIFSFFEEGMGSREIPLLKVRNT